MRPFICYLNLKEEDEEHQIQCYFNTTTNYVFFYFNDGSLFHPTSPEEKEEEKRKIKEKNRDELGYPPYKTRERKPVEEEKPKQPFPDIVNESKKESSSKLCNRSIRKLIEQFFKPDAFASFNSNEGYSKSFSHSLCIQPSKAVIEETKTLAANNHKGGYDASYPHSNAQYCYHSEVNDRVLYSASGDCWGASTSVRNAFEIVKYAITGSEAFFDSLSQEVTLITKKYRDSNKSQGQVTFDTWLEGSDRSERHNRSVINRVQNKK